MLTLKEWMELVDYRVTEGNKFTWDCFGNNAYMLDSWYNTDEEGCSFTIIFDTDDQTVYEVQAHDYKANRAYKMIHPDYKKSHADEANTKSVSELQAWDDVDYTELEVDDDFIQKVLAIKAGDDYDTRVSVPVEFSDAELLKFMTMAHERDITFNQLIEEALIAAIEKHELENRQ